MGWSQTFINSLSGNEILESRLNYPVFHAEAYAGPSGAAKFDLTSKGETFVLSDIIKKLNADNDLKAVRILFNDKTTITIKQSITLLLDDGGAVVDFDISSGLGMFFESRSTGMWWALYKSEKPNSWSWWEGEVQCFDLQNKHSCNRQEAVAMWKEKTIRGDYQQAQTFSDPSDIEQLVQSL